MSEERGYKQSAERHYERLTARAEAAERDRDTFRELYTRAIRRAELELMPEIERLRAALRFYADPQIYVGRRSVGAAVVDDGGQTARAALESWHAVWK